MLLIGTVCEIIGGATGLYISKNKPKLGTGIAIGGLGLGLFFTVGGQINIGSGGKKMEKHNVK